jgi:hypothetical protein
MAPCSASDHKASEAGIYFPDRNRRADLKESILKRRAASLPRGGTFLFGPRESGPYAMSDNRYYVNHAASLLWVTDSTLESVRRFEQTEESSIQARQSMAVTNG